MPVSLSLLSSDDQVKHASAALRMCFSLPREFESKHSCKKLHSVSYLGMWRGEVLLCKIIQLTFLHSGCKELPRMYPLL